MKLSSFILLLCLTACGSPSGIYEITDTEAAKRAYFIGSILFGLDLDDIKTFAFDETNDFCEGEDSCYYQGEYFMVIPTTPNHTCNLILLTIGNTAFGPGTIWRNIFGAEIDPNALTQAWCQTI